MGQQMQSAEKEKEYVPWQVAGSRQYASCMSGHNSTGRCRVKACIRYIEP
jgi:hypothetical protein